MFTRSIRGRFLLWLAFLLVLVLSGFGITAYQLHVTNQRAQIDEELSLRLGALRGDPREWRGPGGKALGAELSFGPAGPRRGPGPGPGRERDRDRELLPLPHGAGGEFRPDLPPREVMISTSVAATYDEPQPGTNGFYFVLWSRGGTLSRKSAGAPPEVEAPGNPGVVSMVQMRTRGTFREAFRYSTIGDCLLVGRNIQPDLAGIRLFAWWLVGAGALVLAFGLGGGWLLATRAIRPVEDISNTATRISVGNLSERISVPETDSELGRLARVLNSTFERLDLAFAQQRQFLADASHELRTPIAVIISEAQTTLQRDRPATEYREALGACLEAAQEMRRLTQSLLELARLDAGQEALARAPVDLAARARACAEMVRPLIEARGLTLSLDLAPASLSGDDGRVAQVITNLLSNAIHYNREHGHIRVATRTEADEAVVEVSDTGCGIAAEDLPRIFERFYRVDAARTRHDGHSGLGLAICKALVEGQGGSISARSEVEIGSQFTVRFPALAADPRVPTEG